MNRTNAELTEKLTQTISELTKALSKLAWYKNKYHGRSTERFNNQIGPDLFGFNQQIAQLQEKAGKQ